jgi:hypothetical protein
MKAVRSKKNGCICSWTPNRDARIWETIEIDSFGNDVADVIQGEVVPEPAAIPAPKAKSKRKPRPSRAKKPATVAVTDAPLEPEDLLSELEGLGDELDT